MGRIIFPDHSIVYLDAAPIIYSVEKNPDYQALMSEVWERVASGDVSAVTSELSFLEVLIHPVRDGDADLVEAYETILAAADIQLVPISVDILRTAVRFRVNQNLKTPDAIHAATALHFGCSHFLSNDTTFRRLTDISTIILSDLT